MARRHPPKLWLMTDERQGDALLPAVAGLPRGAGIVFRHYSLAAPARRALFEAVRRIARRRRLVLVLAGTPAQAAAWRADGAHGRAGGRVARPMLRTISAHGRPALIDAARASADIAFLSPLYPTRSHPNARPLGRVRFALAMGATRTRIVALGGVEGPVRLPGVWGWAAIDSLAPGGQKRKAVPT